MPTRWFWWLYPVYACSDLPVCLQVSCIFFLASGFGSLHEVCSAKHCRKGFWWIFCAWKSSCHALLSGRTAGYSVLDWRLLSVCEEGVACALLPAPAAAGSAVFSASAPAPLVLLKTPGLEGKDGCLASLLEHSLLVIIQILTFLILHSLSS